MKYIKVLALFLFILSFGVFSSLLFVSHYLDIPPRVIISTLIDAKARSRTIESKLNFLILGTDPRDDWLESNQDTDTIILASLDLSSANLRLVSLPRDLWYQPISSRINKIYSKSFDQPSPFNYVKQLFSDITGQKIDYLVIINTDFIKSLVDIVGGLQVELAYTLIDDQYPNPLYILDPVNNPDPYITIKFDQGINLINADNVDYFVRSRKSDTINGGTDMGRSLRQQMLISAIFTKLSDFNNLKLPLIKNLYQLWSHDVTKDISDQDLLSIFFHLKSSIKDLSITPISLPIADSVKGQGIIYNPKYFANNAWVYMPVNNDYTNITKFLDSCLN